jgi:hypothetical protein
MINQPETRPITLDQLIVEINEIYAELIVLEDQVQRGAARNKDLIYHPVSRTLSCCCSSACSPVSFTKKNLAGNLTHPSP